MQTPLDLIRRWRYGGQTGQDVWSAEGRMVAAAIIPPAILTFALIIGAPYVFDPLTAQFISSGTPILFIVAMLVNMFIISSKATEDANSLELALPYTPWKFPDGSIRWFDLKIPREGIEEVCDYDDGSKGIKIRFLERMEWQDKKLSYPYVWQVANCRIPGPVSECFRRLGSGQLFHKNIFVNHNSCDSASFYVMGFEKNARGEYEALCIIVDCALTYEKVLANKGLILEKLIPAKSSNETEDDKKNSSYYMLYSEQRSKLDSLQQEKQVLEEALSVAYKIGGEYVKKNVDATLEAIRSRVHLITDTREPLWNRILKIAWWKVVVTVGALLIVSHFLLGWP